MRRCRLDGSPITYYISRKGQAEWVLFLHAAFVDHDMFRAQVEHFQDRYNILVPDIIGHGASTQTSRGDSIDKMPRWIADIMEAERIEQMHVVGISLGAVLAQAFANEHPEAVRSLACFGAYDINDVDPNMQKENGAAQMLMMLKALFSVEWFARANKRISAYTPQAQEAFYEMNVRFPKKSFMYLSSLGRMMNAHQPQARTYPLLIGCGEHDIPMELKATEMWQKSEPACLRVVFEGAGHCVNMDVPQLFNETLGEFWANGSAA